MGTKTKKLLEEARRYIREPSAFFRETKTTFLKLLSIFRPMRKDYRERLNIKLNEWLLYHQKNIVFSKCYWMGARALKNPFDAWIYQEIIYDVKPDIIIEIGSAEGGSTLYFANLLDILRNGIVISIDIDRTNYKVKHDRITVITGNSSSKEVVSKVAELCYNKSVLLIHDGDHHKEQVLDDLRNYSNFVSLNSYIIVDDGIVDLFKPGDGLGQWWDGPLKAVEQFLTEKPNFVVDKDRERYILTYNPKGFLKRIR